MVERILELLEMRGIKAAIMLRETGINSSAVNDWKIGKAKPSYGSLVKIASFFNVSVEYLQGKTDDPTKKEPAHNGLAPAISPARAEAQAILDSLPDERMEKFVAYLRAAKDVSE